MTTATLGSLGAGKTTASVHGRNGCPSSSAPAPRVSVDAPLRLRRHLGAVDTAGGADRSRGSSGREGGEGSRTSAPPDPTEPTRLDVELGMALRRHKSPRYVENYCARSPLAQLDRAAPCADLLAFDPRFFAGTHHGQVPTQVAELCAACIVRRECLQWALDNDEHGIWAGTTVQDRRKIKRDRAAAS